jgi:hypothetical protein
MDLDEVEVYLRAVIAFYWKDQEAVRKHQSSIVGPCQVYYFLNPKPTGTQNTITGITAFCD